jgi:hypothetical protein
MRLQRSLFGEQFNCYGDNLFLLFTASLLISSVAGVVYIEAEEIGTIRLVVL